MISLVAGLAVVERVRGSERGERIDARLCEPAETSCALKRSGRPPSTAIPQFFGTTWDSRKDKGLKEDKNGSPTSITIHMLLMLF